jgi:hypothetical protein
MLMFINFLYPVTLFLFLIAIVIAAVNRRTSHRTLLIALGLMLLINLALIIAPFFAYGLHQESPAAVHGGAFDPKGYPLFNTEAGSWLHFFALLLLPLTPIMILLLGIRLINYLRLNWQHLQPAVRVYTTSVLLLSASLLAFMATPLGHTIRVWHFD